MPTILLGALPLLVKQLPAAIPNQCRGNTVPQIEIVRYTARQS